MPKEKIINGIELFLISALALFLQMACIRWIPSQVRVLAYYTNLVLLAAFLGWGIGYMIADKSKRFICFFPFILLLNMIVCFIFSRNGIEIAHSSHIYFWQTIMSPIIRIPLKVVLPLFFLLISLLFIPIGQQAGVLFDKIKPVPAYTINILGSVFGIAFYSVLSYNLMPPIWLFGIFMVLYLYFFFKESPKVFFPITVVVFTVVLCWVYYTDKGAYWSPYYKIEISKVPSKEVQAFTLTVNNDYHQMAINLSPEKVSGLKDWQEWARLYEMPFRLHPKPDEVLIVGVGTGNDVAAGLRMGAGHIDAVDIDPLILKIGKKRHPELPYNDKRVSVYVDDARSFFRKTNKKYDAVVFAFLDSHQLFSRMSDLRLDNFVYTVESIREAKSLLKPGGILSITFCVAQDWIGKRLGGIIKEATGENPLVFTAGKAPNGYTFVSGLISSDYKGYEKLPDGFFGEKQVRPSTDNWPFFYLKDPSIPFDYWIVMLVILALSCGLVFITGAGDIKRFQPSFFFLGAGFLLFETKSITRMSLLFGSTWVVNSAVFGAIFITILIANLYVTYVPVRKLGLYYAGLFVSLLVNYFFPINSILFYGFGLKCLFAGLLIGLPIFFSGIIFVKKFTLTPLKSAAMGANLFGAMAGGVLEYSSMIFGFKSLMVLVFLFYVLSMFNIHIKNNKQ